jgi:hypothetical protein
MAVRDWLDEVDQPGLSELREAVANAGEQLRGHRTLRSDAIAGLNGALASVPDGMASGLLAGVNPIYGLYACIAGPIAGGLLSSTQLMVVATTSASALAAGQALAGVPDDQRPGALFFIVVLTGLVQIAFGVLRLGRLTGQHDHLAASVAEADLPGRCGRRADRSGIRSRAVRRATLQPRPPITRVSPRSTRGARYTVATSVARPVQSWTDCSEVSARSRWASSR